MAPLRRALLDVAEVQHFLHVRLDDQLDSAVLLHIVLRLGLDSTRDRIELGVADGRPAARVQAAACDVALLLRIGLVLVDEEEGDLTGAHEGEAPVVLEGPPGGYFTLSVWPATRK